MKSNIFFNQIITVDSVNTLRNMVLNATSNVQSLPSEIIIHFSSPGGNLNAGFTLYNFLRSVQVPLHMHNIGNVDSVAVIIFLAAETRSCSPHSRFKLHNLDWTFSEGSIAHASLTEYSRQLDFERDRYAAIFNERTKAAQSSIDILDCLSGSAKIIDIETARASGITTAPEATIIPAVSAGGFWAMNV